MFPSKVIVSLILLSVAIAERPRIGLQMPSILPPSLHPLIVGGEEAPANSYPFVVSLEVYSQHFCAGSILNEQWVVTAGHCIQMVSSISQLLRVRAGKHNVRITEETEQTVQVERMIIHDKFDGTKCSPYDIGLLKLASPLNLTKQIQPIELAPPESEPTGEAWLCGWGSISNTSLPVMPDKLQHVKMEYIDRSTCNEAVERLLGSSPVHETNICTGPLDVGISACLADSGGPLISRNEEKAVLTGIVSWNIDPCGSAGAPSVYTKVSKFNDWIAQQTGNY